MKHSAAYNIGYKPGAAEGKRGGSGLPDGVCNNLNWGSVWLAISLLGINTV
jgi:hypothetical protein